MKILLLNPPAPFGINMVREGRCMQREGAWTAVWAPITLCTMAAILEENGFQAVVLDGIVEEIDPLQLINILKKEKPDLLVINTATPSILADLGVATLAKKVDPKIKIAAFGIHVSSLPEESFEIEPELDYIIKGEPELTLLELAKELKTGREGQKINGLLFRRGKQIIQGSEREFLENLDDFPFPAWDKIDISKYKLPFTNRSFLLVDMGRGCPFGCKFCAAAAFYGKKVRLPSAKRVVDEMEHDLREFNVSDFLFWSESFTANKKFSLEVCHEILRRELRFNWVCNSRVDAVDLNQLKLFKKAGCWMIGFGVESASNKILDLMNKGVRVPQIKKAISEAKKAGLEVTAHTILGFPGETKKTAEETIELVTHLDIDFAQFYLAVPFPGSKLYEDALKNNWINSSDWSRFEQNFSVLDLPSLSAKEVERLRNKAYRRFYLRPKMILKVLLRLRPKELLGLPSMIKDFLSWV